MKKYSLPVVAALLILTSCGGIGQGIRGKLVDAIFGEPVKNIQVTIVAIDEPVYKPIIFNQESGDGLFQMSLEPGRYRIELEDISQNFKYARQVNPFVVEKGQVFESTYKLDPIVKQWIHGQVFEKETKKPVAGAIVKFDDFKAETGKNGEYEIRNYRSGLMNLEVTAKGYAPLIKEYRMSEGETIEDFELTPSGAIEGAKVKSLTSLVSYVVEASIGSNKDQISSYDSFTVNNAPYGSLVVTGDKEVIETLGRFYKKTGEKFAEIKKDEHDSIVEIPYRKATARIKSAFEQFNMLKKTISTDVVKIESANLVNYRFTANADGMVYECMIWLYFDGNFTGFPTKLVMEGSGKYYEYSFKDYNNHQNIIKQPKL